MQVDFYRFSKKSNSTKRPTSSAYSATYDCVLKDGCSIMSPVIMLEAGLVNRPNFNYAHIDAFGRWYFITDWTFTRRLWVGSLSCDVLATFKPTIANLSLYILRSSARFNGRVTDQKYPVIAQPYTYIDDISAVSEMYQGSAVSRPNYFSKTLATGYYYIGVVGANLSGVTWYCMTPGSFNTLVQALMNINVTDMPDVSPGIAKQLADPMQYIVSCYWLPTDIVGITYPDSGIDINFGRFSVHVSTCAQFDPINDIHEYKASFPIRKHPQAAARGVYLDQAPYTHYSVVFAPFGTFELDSSLMIDDQTVDCSWFIDYTSGLADLTIKVTNSFMVHTSAVLGVPIRLNQATFDYVGAGTGMIGGILGAAGSLLTGNAAGMIGGISGAIGSGLQAMHPKISGTGSSGNFVPFHSFVPKIYTDFYFVADEDNTDLGRPLCEKVTPSSLGGFMIAEDSHFENEYALEKEIDEINAFLTGGFYYE